jgi:hypothetical protein
MRYPEEPYNPETDGKNISIYLKGCRREGVQSLFKGMGQYELLWEEGIIGMGSVLRIHRSESTNDYVVVNESEFQRFAAGQNTLHEGVKTIEELFDSSEVLFEIKDVSRMRVR